MASHHRNISSYDSAGRQLDYVTSEKMHRLCFDGSHERFCVSCKKVKTQDVPMGPCVGTNHMMAVRQVEPELFDDATVKPGGESDCSLTMRDMRRNVGITENSAEEPAITSEVNQARRRIRFWERASVHNCRTVTVVGGGFVDPDPIHA